MGLAPALGSVLLATLLAGKLNDYFRKDGEFFTEDEQGNKTSHCNNANCFRFSRFPTSVCLRHSPNQPINNPTDIHSLSQPSSACFQ